MIFGPNQADQRFDIEQAAHNKVEFCLRSKQCRHDSQCKRSKLLHSNLWRSLNHVSSQFNSNRWLLGLKLGLKCSHVKLQWRRRSLCSKQHQQQGQLLQLQHNLDRNQHLLRQLRKLQQLKLLLQVLPL